MNQSQKIGLMLLIIGIVLIAVYGLFSSFDFLVNLFVSTEIHWLVKVSASAIVIGLLLLVISLVFEKRGLKNDIGEYGLY